MKKKVFLIAFLFLLLICLRLINLTANPPSGLSHSAGIFVDEMHNVHQVRNKILFGSWKMDMYLSIVYSPIFSLFQYIILSPIGIGLWQIKVLPILLSIFSLLLLYQTLNEYYGFKYGLISVVLLGFNYIFIMYNRLGLYENLVIFFMCLTLFFWQRSVKTERPLYFFFTGIAAGFVFIAKSMVFYFVIATAFTFVIFCIKKGLKRTVKQGFAGLLGASVIGLLWYVGYYLPFKENFTILGSSWLKLTVGSGGILEKIITTNPIFHLFFRFQFLPITLASAVIYILFLSYRVLTDPRKINFLEIFIVLWFLSGVFFLNLLSYQPTRYFLPILPPVVLMAVIGLARFGTKEKLNPLKPSDWRLYLISFLGTLMLSFYFFLPLIKKYDSYIAKILLIGRLSKTSDFFISIFVGLLMVLAIASAFGCKRVIRLNTKSTFSLIFLLLLAGLFFMDRPFSSKVKVELHSGAESKFKIYWAGESPSYSEKNSNEVKINKGDGIYSIKTGSLQILKHLRIDPLKKKGNVFIKGIEITQPGFYPILFKTKERFDRFVPIHHISQMTSQTNGLSITSIGNDPYFHTKINPVFKIGLIIKHFFILIITAFLLTAFFALFNRIAQFIRQRFESGLNSFSGKKSRGILCNLIVLLIIFINLFYFSKWVSHADYSILNASKQIGEMLPPSSLIAGQGVMAITIQNKLRHIQAPNWYEDNTKLFQNYPITHLFLSRYSDYLGWFERHYPEVMRYAHVIGKYRILNRNFYLFKIDVPEEGRETVYTFH